jgi:hypothetical protein
VAVEPQASATVKQAIRAGSARLRRMGNIEIPSLHGKPDGRLDAAPA